jgi:hypothetical protein
MGYCACTGSESCRYATCHNPECRTVAFESVRFKGARTAALTPLGNGSCRPQATELRPRSAAFSFGIELRIGQGAKQGVLNA